MTEAQILSAQSDRHHWVNFWILAGLLAVVPAIFAPGLVQAFSLPKAVLAQIGALILSVVFAAQVLLGKQRYLYAGALDLRVVLFMTWVGVATIFSQHVPTAIAGHYSRHEGLLTYAAYFIFYLSAVQVSWDKNKLAQLYKVLIVVAALISLVGLAQFLGLNAGLLYLGPKAQRSASVFGNPIMLVNYLVLILPLGLWLSINAERHRLLYGIATFLTGATIFTSLSRGGWGAALLAVGLFFWWTHRVNSRFRGTIVKIAAVVLALTVILVLIWQLSGGQAPHRLKTLTNSKSVEYRWEIWKTALNATRKSPLVGTGPGGFKFAYWKHQTQRAVFFDQSERTVDHAHNIVLEIAATMGLPAAAFFLAILLGAFRHGRQLIDGRQEDRDLLAPILAGMIGYIVSVSIEPTSVGSGIVFWSFLGIASRGFGAKAALTIGTGEARTSPKTWLIGALASVIVFTVALSLDKPWIADRYAAVARQGSISAREASYRRAIYWNDVYFYRLDMSYIAYQRFKETGRRSDLKTVEAIVNAAIKSHPDEPSSYIILAESYFTAADLRLMPQSAAIAPLKKALTLYPRMPAAHYLLAKVLIKQERFAEAIDELKYVTTVSPEWSQAWDELGLALKRDGQFSAALAAYKRGAGHQQKR